MPPNEAGPWSKQIAGSDREASVLERRKRKSQPAMRGLRPFLRRLDRVAEDSNPVLIIIIIGLAILNCSVFAALELRNLPLRHDSGDAPTRPLTLGEAIGLSRR